MVSQSKASNVHTLMCMSRCTVYVDEVAYANIELRQIFVSPEDRRKGHAKAMIGVLVEVCAEIGARLMLMDVENPHLEEWALKNHWFKVSPWNKNYLSPLP